MSNVRVIKPPFPTFYIKNEVYLNIVDSIPSGFLSTEDHIIEYIREIYGEKNVELSERVYVSEEERMHGTHPYWRIVTARGLISEWRYWFAQYSVRERIDRLLSEGHTITPSASGASYQVINYKDKLIDLKTLDIKMPPKHLAGHLVFR